MGEKNGKKTAYASPRLIRYGDVRTITQGAGMVNNLDATPMGSNDRTS